MCVLVFIYIHSHEFPYSIVYMKIYTSLHIQNLPARHLKNWSCNSSLIWETDKKNAMICRWRDIFLWVYPLNRERALHELAYCVTITFIMTMVLPVLYILYGFDYLFITFLFVKHAILHVREPLKVQSWFHATSDFCQS